MRFTLERERKKCQIFPFFEKPKNLSQKRKRRVKTMVVTVRICVCPNNGDSMIIQHHGWRYIVRSLISPNETWDYFHIDFVQKAFSSEDVCLLCYTNNNLWWLWSLDPTCNLNNSYSLEKWLCNVGLAWKSASHVELAYNQSLMILAMFSQPTRRLMCNPPNYYD